MDDVERFKQRYAVTGDETLLKVEREALGTDYQATAYTTSDQADEMGNDLRLGPGQLLLDIGAGCGWPGLYLAKEYLCAVVSVDLALAGVHVARERSQRDGLSGRSSAVQASADAIPLRSRSVDAIVHADAMC